MHAIAIPLSLSLALVAAQAMAQQSPSPANQAPGDVASPALQQFRALDRNNDGQVSVSEFEDGARSMFEAMDGDGDGQVTVQEMEAARQRIVGRAPPVAAQAAARRIRDLDTNADGMLSLTEHRAAAATRFQDADRDNDGNLTAQEFEAGYWDVMGTLAP